MKYLMFMAVALCFGCQMFLDDWDKIYTDAGDDSDVGDVDCEILYPPLNGTLDLSNGTAYNDVATYGCNDGYVLSGVVTRTCAADGAWTDEPPKCLSITVELTETWHEVPTCAPESTLEISVKPGELQGFGVIVNQIRAGEAGLSVCSGHTAVVSLIGDDQIDIAFTGGAGGCAPSCFDLFVDIGIPDLPYAEYTITVGDLSTTETVNP